MIHSEIAVLLSLFQPEHMILVAFIVLLLFGGKKIPELMRGMGKGVREFNDAKDNVKREIESTLQEPKKTESTSVESKG
jgi:sec-independent protein translocase protein TatA